MEKKLRVRDFITRGYEITGIYIMIVIVRK